MLQEVMLASVKTSPKLAKWSRYGPTYYKWFDDDGVPHHSFVFRFHDKKWRTWFGAEFKFRETGGLPLWEVRAQTPRGGEWYYEDDVSSLCDSEGALSTDKMRKAFLGDVRRLGVVL